MPPVRQTLELDLRRALSQINDLESSVDELRRPVVIPIDLRGDAPRDIREIDERLEEIEVGAGRVNRELAEMELAAGSAVADFSRLATELGISETEARELSRGILDARLESERTSEAAKDVARQLGLSEDEAKQFASEVGKAAGRMDDVDDSARRANVGVERLRSTFARLAATAIAFVGFRELARFAGDSLQAFSNLEESTSKAQVVFGDFSDEIFDFTSRAPTELGSTRAAAIETASSFGNLFLSVGLGQEKAAEFSTTLLQLGTDLASFNNISVDEALEKLRSGLVGQAEPLRTVGVLLSEAAVQAKGFELGLGGATGKLTEAEKVQARYAIIMEQTTTAQGDFARTSTGIANSQRTVAALFGELQTKVGEGLAPAFKELVDLAPEIIAGFENMVPSIAAAALALADFFRPKPGQADLLDIVNFLTDLSRGFGQTFDAGTAVVGTLGHINEALGALQQGDLNAFWDSMIRGDEVLREFGRNAVERTGLQAMIQDIRDGIEPAQAFANAIALIGRRGVIDRQTVDNFLAISRINPGQARAELTRLIDEAERLKFSADEVLVLKAALQELNQEFIDGERANDDYLENIRKIGTASEQAVPGLLSQLDVLTLLRSEADLLGISFEELVTGGAEKFPELAELINQLAPATAGLGVAQENLNTFADSLEDTNIRISGEIDEFGKLPEKLKTSKAAFLANLTVSAAEEAAFQANLIKLFDIAPALATFLQQGGVANRDLVVDFLDDITSAERADAILSGNAEDVIGTYTGYVEDAIATSDLDQAGIEALIKFLEGFGNTAVVQTAIAALQGLLQDEINKLKFSISGGQFSFESGFNLVAGTGPFTGTIGAGVTLIQNTTINNPTTTDLPTNTAQLQQSQAAVAGLINQTGPF